MPEKLSIKPIHVMRIQGSIRTLGILDTTFWCESVQSVVMQCKCNVAQSPPNLKY